MPCSCKLKSGPRKGLPCGAKVSGSTRFCSKHQTCIAVQSQPIRSSQQQKQQTGKPIFLNLYETLFPGRFDADIIELVKENSEASDEELMQEIENIRDRWTSFYLPNYLDDIKYKRAEKYVKKNNIPIGSILYLGTSSDRELYGFAEVMPGGRVVGKEDFYYLTVEGPDGIRQKYPAMAEDIIKLYEAQNWF